jgi:hypothetical protein
VAGQAQNPLGSKRAAVLSNIAGTFERNMLQVPSSHLQPITPPADSLEPRSAGIWYIVMEIAF